MLRIGDATRVRWEWFFYGRPKVAANRYFEDFVKTPDGGIDAATNIDWYTPILRPRANEAAVEIM